MQHYEAEASQVIDAPPDRVYDIISDYRNGHPRILPPRYFEDMRIEAGGQGEGTIASFQMKVLGTKTTVRARVAEPEPGRILEEEDILSGVVTTFRVDPVDGAKQANVTITTRGRTSPGLKGMIERLLNPVVLSKIYRDELNQLARIAKTEAA